MICGASHPQTGKHLKCHREPNHDGWHDTLDSFPIWMEEKEKFYRVVWPNEEMTVHSSRRERIAAQVLAGLYAGCNPGPGRFYPADEFAVDALEAADVLIKELDK